jgi:hypothetical protein
MRTLTKLGVAMSDRFSGRPGDGVSAPHAGPEPADEDNIHEIAASLDITPKRILSELASIAFSDLSRIVEWAPGEDGLRIKLARDLDPRDVSAIAELVASASTGRIYRIKLHDKRGALGLLTRCLDMLPKRNGANHDQPAEDDGDDEFDDIVREIDRRVAEKRLARSSSGPAQLEEAEACSAP